MLQVSAGNISLHVDICRGMLQSLRKHSLEDTFNSKIRPEILDIKIRAAKRVLCEVSATFNDAEVHGQIALCDMCLADDLRKEISHMQAISAVYTVMAEFPDNYDMDTLHAEFADCIEFIILNANTEDIVFALEWTWLKILKAINSKLHICF